MPPTEKPSARCTHGAARRYASDDHSACVVGRSVYFVPLYAGTDSHSCFKDGHTELISHPRINEAILTEIIPPFFRSPHRSKGFVGRDVLEVMRPYHERTPTAAPA